MTDPKELEEELIRCSCCKSMKFKSLFRIKETNGRILKTCIKCREKYKCNIENCDYSCSSNSHLQQHIKGFHNKIKDIVCDKCDYSCSRNSHLQQHIKQVHNQTKDFICNIEDCNYSCSSKGNLQKHIKGFHNQVKDIECNIQDCNYSCTSNSHLQQHIKQVHNQIKDFICDKCDYSCSSKGHLQIHIKGFHNKIKDFKCNTEGCIFKCSDNSHLQRHIKICTGNRNISSGEFEVINNLEKLGLYEDIDYIHDSTFIELTNYCNRNLRFDFRLINHKIIIEFDGEQHFKPVSFGGMSEEQALKTFEDQQVSDRIKDEFCKKFDYKMIRITYKQFPNILSILHSELLDIVELD
jgi:uncharacterized Zn-finger protein